ncbi:hypothetical protein ACLESO_13760 [Pyxidicoccus sp. 3LG]
MKRFASEGWNVIATMRSPSAATELAGLPDVPLLREQEAARNTSLADYDSFIARTNTVFDGLRAARANSTSEEVARVIFRAAADG